MSSDLLFGIIFLLLAIAGMVIKKTYYAVPAYELKRRAERHDETAAKFFKVVSYGDNLNTLLWVYIGLTTAVSLILLAKVFAAWLGVIIIGGILYLTFFTIPNKNVGGFGIRLTKLATPLVAWFLSVGHPALSKVSREAKQKVKDLGHTGLYEKEDIFELIDKQESQKDSRISPEELNIVKRVLNFSDQSVADITEPLKSVKTILANETLGPIVIDELHKSGEPYYFVKESPKGQIIGVLAVSELGIHKNGLVRDVMDQRIHYLNENDSLSEALHAFYLTNQPLFIVVNNVEETVGVITTEAILKDLLGHIPGGEFDEYTDLVAVAARHHKKLDYPDDESPLEVIE